MLSRQHLGRLTALPFVCTGDPLLYSAGQSFAFIFRADDVTALASEGKAGMLRYPKCGKVVKASDLRAHVGVHMSTDPNLAMCGFCGGLGHCTAVVNRNGQAQPSSCQHGCWLRVYQGPCNADRKSCNMYPFSFLERKKPVWKCLLAVHYQAQHPSVLLN
jgi:hypothetical protein